MSSRGKAEFSVGKMISADLSSDFSRPSYFKKMEVQYDSKGDDKYYELDPVTRINKGFDFEDDLEIKGPGISYGGDSEGNNQWEEQRQKVLEETSQFNKNKPTPTLKPKSGYNEYAVTRDSRGRQMSTSPVNRDSSKPEGTFSGSKNPSSPLPEKEIMSGRSPRSGGTTETIMPSASEPPKLSAVQRIKQGATDLSGKVKAGMNNLGSKFSKLSTPSKIGVIGAVGTGLAGLGYMGTRSKVQDDNDLSYKGFIPEKWKRRGEMAVAAGVMAANPKKTVIGSSILGEENNEKNVTELDKLVKNKAMAICIDGVQSRRDKNGFVKSIVDELKKSDKE